MGDKQKPFIGKRSDANRLHLDNKFIIVEDLKKKIYSKRISMQLFNQLASYLKPFCS